MAEDAEQAAAEASLLESVANGPNIVRAHESVLRCLARTTDADFCAM